LNSGGNIGIYASGAADTHVIYGCTFVSDTIGMDGDGGVSAGSPLLSASLFADGAKITREAANAASIQIDNCCFEDSVTGDQD